MPLTHDLRHFKLSEFKHPELVDETAALLLDEIREQYGQPLVLTDDARTPDEKPEGYSPTSLHYKGQAFDIRSRDMSKEDMWRLVRAVVSVADWVAGRKATTRGVELEIVSSATDKHVHIGFFLGDGRLNRLFVKSE